MCVWEGGIANIYVLHTPHTRTRKHAPQARAAIVPSWLPRKPLRQPPNAHARTNACQQILLPLPRRVVHGRRAGTLVGPLRVGRIRLRGDQVHAPREDGRDAGCAPRGASQMRACVCVCVGGWVRARGYTLAASPVAAGARGFCALSSTVTLRSAGRCTRAPLEISKKRPHTTRCNPRRAHAHSESQPAMRPRRSVRAPRPPQLPQRATRSARL